MQTWVETDGQGRQFLVRTGTGVVTAVTPVGIADEDEGFRFCRVEIYCDAPHGRPGSIRYSAHPLVGAGDPLLDSAREALEQVWAVAWTIQWRRHDWVPGDLAIGTLNLATDARCLLVALEPVTLPDLVQADGLGYVPDYVPLHWKGEHP